MSAWIHRNKATQTQRLLANKIGAARFVLNPHEIAVRKSLTVNSLGI